MRLSGGLRSELGIAQIVGCTRHVAGHVTPLAALLVRVEVLHELPGVRDNPYPILVTMQPLALNGAARFLLNWNTGGCGGGPASGPPIPPGAHVNCEPEGTTDI